MRIKSYAYRILGAVCAFATIACVDQSFDLNNVSKEVTVGSGKTTLPIGYIEDKTLGDLLEGQDIEGLTIDENGNLSFSYEGESETINIEGISTEFEIPQIANAFKVEYPSFNFDMRTIAIEANETISVGGFDSYSGTNFTIPEGINIPITGNCTKVFEGDDLHIEFDVPEQINNINKIYFRDIENGHYGAPMHIHVDFNGLADVNGGGYVEFVLNIEGGSFRILDADNKLICDDGNTYDDTYPVASGTDSIDFVIYIESITNNTALNENHHLDIPLKFTYSMNFEFTTKTGTVNLNSLPEINLDAELAYGDAEVAVNSDIELVDYAVEDGEPIEIKDLPTELKMVNRVSMLQNDDSILNFYAHGMDWLVDLAEDIEVVVGLPSYLKLHHVDGESYDYNEATCEITTTIAQLDKGVKIAIEALDFGAEGLEPDSAGEIELDFKPSIRAHFKEGAQVNVSALKYEEELNIEVGIEESRLAIESFSGKVDYTYEVDQSFEISGLEDLGLNLEIDGIGIKPIIEVNITHLLTISAMLSGSVTPSVGGVANEANAVSFNNIELKSATYSNGAIEDAEVTLIIADESLRANYADERYTFVACDVTKLLRGSLPEALDVKLQLGVDSEEGQTLYIADNLAISYAYSFNVPFAVDETLDVRYSDEIDGLNSIFEQLSEYDIKVGDIAVIATVSNSTPLQLGAAATLKDVNGNLTDVQLTIADDAIIEGSADGVTPKVSRLRFDLDLGDGRLANITAVDAIAFDLVATSAAVDSSVPLNTNQVVGVKLQLELAGGITVDLEDFEIL